MTVLHPLRPRKPIAALCWLVLASVGVAGAALAQPGPEVQVSTREISDFEFDWGRDGTFCPTCNQGAGNARLTFVDRRGQLWVGVVDVATGDFIPSDGRNVLVDVDAAIATDFGNGPEWMVGAEGSQIAYTKYVSGQPHAPENAGIALATLSAGGWSADFVAGGEQRKSPLGSLDVDDPQPRLVYGDMDSSVFWRYALDPQSETLIPEITGLSGASRRWVPGLQKIIFTAPAPSRFGGPGVPQVFVYDLLAQEIQQLTFDANTKFGAFMWQAPEFAGEYIMFALVNVNKLIVYREIEDRRGRLRWQAVASIKGTPALPFIWSPEPFVHNGHSYIMMQLSASPDPTDVSTPSHIALAGIEPGHHALRVLTDESALPRVRMDPEYFITAQGPYIYYPRYVPLTDSTLFESEGLWRVDTGLGPPDAGAMVSTAPDTAQTAGGRDGGVGYPDRVPSMSALRGVYPNPAGHQQIFEILVVPGQQLGDLRVYDVRGRLVMERSLRGLGAGTHRIEWDGRADSGQRLSSGVYSATVMTPAGLESKKIVRIK